MTTDEYPMTSIVAFGKEDDLVEAVRANLDPLGAVVVGNAILVMAQLANGALPKDVSNGITGAVALLVSHLSPRGEEFRREWNLHVDPIRGALANEKGNVVLDPAVRGRSVAVMTPLVALLEGLTRPPVLAGSRATTRARVSRSEDRHDHSTSDIQRSDG